MKPDQILHILGSAASDGTGVARMVAALAQGLDPRRFRVHAWFLGADGPLAAQLQRAGAEVRLVHWQDGSRDPAGAWRFWRGLRNARFALVHQHVGGRSVRWMARRAARAGLIHHLHGRTREGHGMDPGPTRPPAADVVIATSHAVACQLPAARARVVYPGAAAETVAERPQRMGMAHDPVIGAAGRLVPIKGMGYLIRAVAILSDSHPSVRLEIAGSGPDREALEKETRRLGLSERVRFLGWQENLASAFAAWDVFVQPSLEEGFGIVALEAMAAGLPVVASRVGGLSELVEHGQTGYLVPPGDAAALAERLGALISDQRGRRVLGAAGLTRAAERFSLDQMVSAISSIYDGMLLSPVHHAAGTPARLSRG